MRLDKESLMALSAQSSWISPGEGGQRTPRAPTLSELDGDEPERFESPRRGKGGRLSPRHSRQE